MTLDQLRMLVAVADSGSVLAAAEKLGRTQPTVSVGLRKLEAMLGVVLLDRARYRLRLTPAGAMLCDKARLILRQARELQDLAGHLKTGREPELTLAIEASCPMPLVLRILQDAERRFPSTRFTLTAETLWGALEKIKLNQADLAITPWFNDEESLDSLPLTAITMTTVAAPGFPPLQSGQPILLDDLRHAVQVVVRDSSKLPPTTSYGVLEDGRHWLVNDHETKKKLILAGLGWGRLQNHLITEELAERRLVPLKVDGYPGTRQIDLRVVRRSDKQPGPVARELWKSCQELSGSGSAI